MQARLLLLSALIVMGLGLWIYLHKSPQQNALLTRELATWGMAEYLARSHPGHRALAISNPFTQQKGLEKGIYAQEEAGIRGLQKGFENRIILEAVAFPDLKPAARDHPFTMIDKESVTPLSYLVADGAFDKVARSHPTCDLIVSLIGLPADLSKVEIWRQPGAPKFALLLPDLRVIGDADAVQRAVRSGKLAAIVLKKPGAPSDHVPPGEDHAREFERRFILATAENIEKIIQAYPHLFGATSVAR